MRWILGEQSAKSLRGGEMADVIFNGSASRRSLGLAEVTMTFDNTPPLAGHRGRGSADHPPRLPQRRGRIPHQPPACRLKDIKDLFLGSGAGTDAYCIIEQGRVDVLLQASTKDRRTIFEEAAGISRFKAKKIETLRKLERVDQNLQRLRDIIDEVEKQLRSVKLQAAKAQRYQEYSGRLRGAARRPGPSRSITELDRTACRLETAVAGRPARQCWTEQTRPGRTAGIANARRLEEALAAPGRGGPQQEALLAAARQQIAAEETTLDHEWALAADLETD